ncbi:MAG: hypothetical protein PWR03_1566 [Tenuifilum sp.]|jgi:small-conductance mechanosensitive channel|uniref:mechanosensitive ion channel family protein n=1 Tax=Tenuifilum sp. TaxID=2760880 RepID=UPI0024ABA14B|nr:mechanosensitive ion channel domain-containing protein [Tenuifilum sp.]MDI3527383.1 hypothetical protein [Tenuifilum sp.]
MKEILNTKIIEIGEYVLRLQNLLSFVIFLVIVIAVYYSIKRLIFRSKTLQTSMKYTVSKLLQYIIIFLSFIISLKLLGFNISVLLAGSAALLVGVGFGLQNIFNDFISGIILLLDGTLKVGDIIEVNGKIYKVLEISFRYTIVLGRDENYIILPNSSLTSNTVINWTHSEVASRFKITVGVDYSSDVPKVMRILKEVAAGHAKVLSKPEPFVRFEDYADSALIFGVYFYTDEVFRVENIKSEIRIQIYKAFKENGINIPFPQRVIHFSKDADQKDSN